jgi:hypothetical protein
MGLDLQISGEAIAKSRPARKYARSRNGLVPPPPPVVLPAAYAGHGIYQAPTKPKTPYKKYVYCREGYEEPPSVKVNKHVTYWNLQ